LTNKKKQFSFLFGLESSIAALPRVLKPSSAVETCNWGKLSQKEQEKELFLKYLLQNG